MTPMIMRFTKVENFQDQTQFINILNLCMTLSVIETIVNSFSKAKYADLFNY